MIDSLWVFWCILFFNHLAVGDLRGRGERFLYWEMFYNAEIKCISLLDGFVYHSFISLHILNLIVF